MTQRRCAPRAGIFLCVVTLLFVTGCGRSGLDDDELFPGDGSGGTSAGGVTSGGLTGRGGSSGGTINTGGRPATGGFGNAGAGGNGGVGGVNTGGRAPGGAGGVSTGGRAPGGAGGVSTGGRAPGGAGGVSTGGSPATGGSPSSCASTCSGCCDAAGDCEPGDSANACGASGARCLDCGSSGFGCVNSICQGPPPTCGPSNCDGCCDALARCRDGTEIDACGFGGGACDVCSDSDTPLAGCSGSGKCEAPVQPCGPSTCGGCCKTVSPMIGPECFPGNADNACGAGAAQCSDCRASGRECNQPGSYCTFVPACSATTCPDGCCDSSGTCRNGRVNEACGVSGQLCQDCAHGGRQCAAAGFCYDGAHCGPDNCGGCCTANGQCVAGANNARCGRYGALCDNCASQNETCQNGACGAPGATCPAPYGGCSPGAMTTPPPTSTSCTAADLAALASACNGPKPTPACRAELTALLRSSPGCFDCLQPFLNPTGVAACLAPFLNSTCNHDLTCSLACTNVACGACPANGIEACQDEAFTASGTCRSYVNGNYCAIAAFGGPGAFCDLERIGDVGVWLQGVGAYYCSK